jgi:TfoX/Sxy family transcriptional regulator of competence genes
MAYDEDLADRIRDLLAERSDVTEKTMFGGRAFLIGGSMAVTASGRGGIMVRVDPAETDRLLASTKAGPMEMRGRVLDGWVRVDAADVRTKRQLAPWVRRGTEYAASLPTSTKTKAKTKPKAVRRATA